jgi:hypothetical protein
VYQHYIRSGLLTRLSLVVRTLRVRACTVASEWPMAAHPPPHLFGRRPRIAAAGGIESLAAHQILFELRSNRICHGVADLSGRSPKDGA